MYTNKRTLCKWIIGILIILVLSEAAWIYTLSIRIRNENEEWDFSLDTELSEHFDSALESGEIEVWFQPIAEAGSLELWGSEALSRWKKDGEYISPSVFISILEDSGQIVALDEHVFKTVCEIQEKRIREGKELFPISVNLSGISLQSEGIAQRYENICGTHHVPEKYISIEITETVDADPGIVEEVAREFSSYGFTIEMDDFGAGYASFANLAMIDYSVLKIDKSLVDMIGTERGEAVIKEVIELAHSLGMTVIAEGVEREDQVTFLHENGCDAIQGYVYSRPLPLEEWELFVSGDTK